MMPQQTTGDETKNKNQEKLNTLVAQLKTDQFKYTPKEHKPIDWASYDQAQVNEINDMLNLTRDIIDQAASNLNLEEAPKHAVPGRPRNSPADEAKVIMMAQYFCVSNRVAQGYMLLFKEKLHLKKLFSYKTIERAYGDILVKQILNEVFELTNDPVRELEHVFGPDATGISTSSKQNYENDRRSGDTHKGYEKILVMVGLTYKLISAFQFAKNPSDNESPYFEPLLMETAQRYERVDLVSADSAYMSRHNCNLTAEIGAEPRFYPKVGVTLRQKGSVAWRRMLEDLMADPQKWLEEYHTRSNTEGSFSTLKRDCPIPLRKKLQFRKEQESFSRNCNYNLKRLCYLCYLKSIVATEAWKK